MQADPRAMESRESAQTAGGGRESTHLSWVLALFSTLHVPSSIWSSQRLTDGRHSHLTAEQTEAQRGKVTCSRSQSS